MDIKYQSSKYRPEDVARRYVAWMWDWRDKETKCTVFEVDARSRTVREYTGADEEIPQEIRDEALRLHEDRQAYCYVEWPL